MHSLQQSIPTRNPEFVVAIMDASIAEVVTPYMLGALDAQKGVVCNPTGYYTKDGAIAEYRQGYIDESASIAAKAVDTRQRMTGRLLTAAEMAEAAADYEGDIEDRNYHAFGAW